MPAEHYNIGCYLLDRLEECGCAHLFGVPGDYNLRFLDDVMAKEKSTANTASPFKWIGCANELNAAYAAEAYSKVKLHYTNRTNEKQISAILTTFGVGEISALNGIAGAMSERSPVLHIVGGPSTATEARRDIMHHTLGEGQFRDFVKMSEPITCARAVLYEENAREEIDRVLLQMIFHKRPGFVLLPLDVANAPCDPPSTPLEPIAAPVSEAALQQYREAVQGLLANSRHPALLAGYLCDRYGGSALTHTLITKTNLPFAVQIYGKGVLDESLPQFVGSYCGSTSLPSVRQVIEEADMLVTVGAFYHDIGTNFFSQKIDPLRTIAIQPFEVTVGGRRLTGVPMEKALLILTELATAVCAQWPQTIPQHITKGITTPDSDKGPLTAFHFYTELEDNLSPNDILIADIGTTCISASAMVLPHNALFVNQFMWAAIGNALPAALAAQLACPDRRVILLIGDGAAQMTMQEIGTFVRYGLKPILFLVNNDGYVIERIIHGWDEPYNDIQGWDYCQVVTGMTRGRADCKVIETIGDTAEVLKQSGEGNMNKGASSPGKMLFREVMLGRHELPVVTTMKR
ncbi:Thiamine pyrophosphate enzyme, N-terminal TPP binding domain/Thiamine pyrophosphate enzyme, central domain/Thiamine pyrophosphate enzyme, C-terminal TPP binding domain containing protein, putative [Angomonas deanei]|uniref:Thiamine pyrophosphate enzyme, N-terminal TPP binding domain/Thiamine pyrophosphate enzyme, central domain/Thiamine pyrophosphate enzyme, C-terminal TPP binding domain containing protein, putative n=1 Tax=Angomonas deanei TaxID=59799 RepID=A0A7G2C234_9TRYP|nr:Thiamine pyrophosphate enzyme, N-terminal TPP binding domain/Thiamine pyrophosphate enzyme, central domain/Thiamine pyrophosphate enzyme, C-terminal TPP binding domain containing protein, putative [Angomonas deanei]